jgi:hypothetical protein
MNGKNNTTNIDYREMIFESSILLGVNVEMNERNLNIFESNS